MDFKTLQETISKSLVATTRSATRLSAADIPFQRSLDPSLGTALDLQNARLLQLAQRLLANAASSSDTAVPQLPDVEAIDNNWKGIVDVVDSLLEKADTSLDEYTGVVKRLAPGAEEAGSASKSRFPVIPKTFPKPQLTFEHLPNNNETGGFRPLITSKPHAKVPFEECMKTTKDSNGREQYPHPYQTEIESYEYPASMYEQSEPQLYTPFESTTATLVDTPEALVEMLAELKTAKEIAIDLEHHDNRTYVGIVSLMQISTRNKDWIIDTLKPWRRRLECLNEVFADPNILKILHGAYMDIIWLQRDLGLYVVGLFDTYHAARALGYPGASLAFLLDKFVNFKAQKQYQMADWRVRPLSDELFNYARADTHFLLYIFDNMRNELVERSNFSDPEKDKVTDVLQKSRETALQRYEHPIYDHDLGLGPGGWYRLLTKTPVQYTPQQFAVFRAVHKWRDDIARAEDESVVYIMPNHAVFSIARNLPTDKAALFSVTQHISHVVRARADELVAVIAEAKAAADAPDMNETLKKIQELRLAEWEAAKPVTPTVEAIQATPTLKFSSLLPQPEAPPLRAPASNFWGPLQNADDDDGIPRRSNSPFCVSLALPLPPLTAQIFADGPGKEEETMPEKPEHTFVPKEQRPAGDDRTDIFIVKQLGGKRKRTQVESPESTSTPEEASLESSAHTPSTSAEPLEVQADELMLDAAESERRARRRAEKKEAKLQKQAAKEEKARLAESEGGADQEEDGKMDEEPAFDYASAPSVLRAKEAQREKDRKEGGKKKKDRKKSQQGFNPYAKMADAPKGLPRTQKERAGKTKTFKS